METTKKSYNREKVERRLRENPKPKLVLGLGFCGIWIEREERERTEAMRFFGSVKWFIGKKEFGFFTFDDGRVTLSDLELVAFAVVQGVDGKTKAGGVNGYGGRSRRSGGGCCKFEAIRHQARDCNEGGHVGEATAAEGVVFPVDNLGLSPVFAHKVAVAATGEVVVFVFFVASRGSCLGIVQVAALEITVVGHIARIVGVACRLQVNIRGASTILKMSKALLRGSSGKQVIGSCVGDYG